MLVRLFWNLLVYCRLDMFIAELWYRRRWPPLRRLLPSPALYDGRHRFTVRHGAKFRLSPVDLSQWNLYYHSQTRHLEMALSQLEPASEGLIIDVGAHIGQFTLPLARHFEKLHWNKSVMAFEPNPIVFTMLKRNLFLNKHLHRFVKLYQVGLGAEDTYMELYSPRKNTANGSLVQIKFREPHDTFMVAIRRLDMIVKTRVDFIRISVQGFEYFVLRGATQIIEKYRPTIYLETGAKQPHLQQILHLLIELKYDLFSCIGGQLEPLDLRRPNSVNGCQVFLAKSQRG